MASQYVARRRFKRLARLYTLSMDKTAFLKILREHGFICDMADGIPTVHAASGDKHSLKELKSLVKESGYDSSFAFRYDGKVLDESDGEPAKEQTLPDELVDIDKMGTEAIEAISEDAAVEAPDEAMVADTSAQDSDYDEPVFDIFSQSLWNPNNT